MKTLDFFKFNNNSFIKTLLLSLRFLLAGCCLYSCHSGGTAVGSLSSNTSSPTSVINITVPTVVMPVTNPYVSSENSVTLSGLCMSGNTVRITDFLGQDINSELCENYSYSLTISKNQDSIYSFFISQTDSSGQMSSPVLFVWVKKSSVAMPMVTVPNVNIYNSALDQLTISGSCESNAIVSLLGDGVGQTMCVDSEFSIALTKANTGLFAIVVRQTDAAGNFAETSFQWNKINLDVSPSAPTLQVGSQQNFSLVGGSGVYTVALTDNQSGGSYDSINHVYTAGTIAFVTDQLTITDSQGVSKTVLIRTYPDVADHLIFAANDGNTQVAVAGQLLPLPLSAQVVDRFGNGVSFYPVFFQSTFGEGIVSGGAVKISDLNGFVEAQIIAGDQQINNIVRLSPLSAVLPDVNGTGNSHLVFTFTSEFKGKGQLGGTFSIGANANAIATADLNADGFQDVVVSNVGDSSLGVLLGLGNGLFKNMQSLRPVCSQANGIALSDINEDGRVDISISCGSSTLFAVQILLGQGDGIFSAPVGLSINNDFEIIPLSIQTIDLNQDGHLDIITSNAGSANVSIRQGIGDGSFLPPVFVSVGNSPSDLAVGDFNKDNIKDIVVLSSADSTATFLRGLGGLSYDNTQFINVAGAPLTVKVADFNKDTYDDLAILSSSDSNVSILLNDTFGDFYERTSLPTGFNPTAMSVKDIDRDGQLDIAVTSNLESTLSLFFGLGGGSFDGSLVPMAVSLNPSAVAISNVNQDDVEDILVIGSTMNELQVLPGQNNHVFGYLNKTDINPVDAAFGDFDRDGQKDIAVLNKGDRSLVIYKGLSHGLFVRDQALSTGDNSVAVYAVDLSRRGILDLIVINPNQNMMKVFKGIGDGGFQVPVDMTTGLTPVALQAADFDRDGLDDIVVVNSGSNTVSVFLGAADGLLQPKIDSATGENPVGLTAVDLNQDGLIDIATVNQSSNSVSVLLGQGNGQFRSRIDYNAGNAPSAIVNSDFNGDGLVDIAVNDTADNMVGVLIGRGDGSLNSVNQYWAGQSSTGLVTGDFNGDNKQDIAVANAEIAEFTILIGAGNGQFNTTQSYSTRVSANGLKSADINNDSALDIIIFDSTKNNFQVWLGH